MKAAASNQQDARPVLWEWGMASSAGGMNAQQLFEMGQKQQTQAAAQNTQPQQKIQPAADGDSWT